MKKLLVDANYIRDNLGYSMSTIKTANKFHGFPCPVLKIANRYQWRLSDIEKWVKNHHLRLMRTEDQLTKTKTVCLGALFQT